MERKDELEARVRETPLSERLSDCRKRIGKMCSEGRPPRMCIPVQWDDDDFYISTTLADAQRALDALQAQLARWKEALGEWGGLGGCGYEGRKYDPPHPTEERHE